MHCGNSIPPTDPALSLSIGIAALVLEGRILCKDEYADETMPKTVVKPEPVASSSFACGSGSSSFMQGVLGTTNVRNQSQSRHRSQPPPGFRLEHAVQDIQRLRQKLLLIRSAPSTSNDVAQQLVSVHVSQQQLPTPPQGGYDSDDELEWIYRQQQLQLHEGNLLNSLQNLATSTCLKTTPRSFNRTQGLLQTVEAWTSSGYVVEQQQSQPQPSSSYFFSSHQSTSTSVTKNVCTEKKTNAKQYGPHCEDFLKSIGLIKNNTNNTTANLHNSRIQKHIDILDPDKHICSEHNANVSVLVAI